MSCFWDTLFRNIQHEKKSFCLVNHYSNKGYNGLVNYYQNEPSNRTELCLLLKKKNKFTRNVLCNGEEITEKQMKENFEHVKDYDISTMNNGYFCSTFDPFLFLISELYEVKIINNYMTLKVIYDNKKNSNYEIIVNNNDSHMW